MDAVKVSWRLGSLAFVISIIIFFIVIIFIIIIFIIIIMFCYTILVNEWIVVIIIIIIILLLLSHHSCTELIKSFHHMFVVLIIPASKCWHACPFVSTNFYCVLIVCCYFLIRHTNCCVIVNSCWRTKRLCNLTHLNSSMLQPSSETWWVLSFSGKMD